MAAVALQLVEKLLEREPEVSVRVEAMVAETIELADADVLDLGRSRGVEQEVLDLLDESALRFALELPGGQDPP